MSNLIATWPAPPNIGALTTYNTTGFSQPPFASNNLAYHVGDNEQHVQANRRALSLSLGLPNEPAWLEQTHTNQCVIIEEDTNRVADAAITRQKTSALAIMTADCLPILLCDQQGTEIAAIHAGWRGLANGIIENTLAKMKSPPATLLAWIGPAICQSCYETGEDVKHTFITRYPFTNSTFLNKNSHLYANLPKMAELILQSCGVTAVYQSAVCTFESKQLYSYRREAQTGRIATLIWFKQEKL